MHAAARCFSSAAAARHPKSGIPFPRAVLLVVCAVILLLMIASHDTPKNTFFQIETGSTHLCVAYSYPPASVYFYLMCVCM